MSWNFVPTVMEGVDIEHLQSLMTEEVAALMLTNPQHAGTV